MTDKLNSFISKITSKKWTKLAINSISKKTKEHLIILRKAYRNCAEADTRNPLENGLYNSFYIIERECKMLIKQSDKRTISALNETPILGSLSFLFADKLSLDVLIKAIKKLQDYRYISNTDISTIDLQLKFVAIKTLSKAIKENDYESFNDAISSLFIWDNIDYEQLNIAVNPIEEIYSSDYYYLNMSKETKQLYRDRTSLIAQNTGIDEQRLAGEYIARCKKAKTPKECHVGNYIFSDFERIFPRISAKSYTWLIFLFTAILSGGTSAIVSSFWFWILLFFPYYAIVKVIFDEIIMRKMARNGIFPLPRMDLQGGISENYKTIAVISTLITSDKEISHLEKMVEELSYTNPAKSLYFCILGDLKGSNNANDESDFEIIKKAQKLSQRLNEKVRDRCVLIIRKREFCKTQNNFSGWERKRGAIHQLINEISGEKQDFLEVFGDRSILFDASFICALDYDTKALMDSISELVSIAIHPLNQPVISNKKVISGYGIICPRITNSLASSLKTPFAKLMGGVGGTCTYDDFSADLYQSSFSEGIFTGKGLIDVRVFKECCQDRFESETVLSHDILEGSFLRTAYAGDVEFSDSFPLTSIGFFKRLERWLRGDVQNIPFLSKKKGINLINRFKIWDNVRRCLNPVLQFLAILVGAFTPNGWILATVTLVSIIIPYITNFVPNVLKWGIFGFSRKFYSGIKPQATQLFIQCVLSILLLPKTAIVSANAFTLAVWRRFITKKNLLQWATASQTDKLSTPMKTLKEFILTEVISLILIISFKPFFMALGVIFLSALPVMIYCNTPYSNRKKSVENDTFDQLKHEAEKMWNFYKAFVTSSESFLPPDNVQYAPVFAIAHRTSPTNMGMYAVSVLCARDFSFIDTGELYFRISCFLNSTEHLEKWKGNLFNWYDTRTTETLSRIVSSVDSGNFLCSLVVLKEGLWEYESEDSRIRNLISRIESLIENADLSAFYDKARGLFTIAYDEGSGEFSNNHYDLLMSEARMTSYFAIAMGHAPKSHWKRLGHTMSRLGNYAGPVSWTGTMFEYFMPELFLKCPEGSLGYEALNYAVYCQRYRAGLLHIPFGFSESGFYAFDSQLNYQYKAHGTQYLGLKRDLHKEVVVSPYSSFLVLSHDLISAVKNLVRLEKMGASHRDYGFYEAVDFTPQRVNENGYCIVKSHMAHHVGMSIISISNAIMNGVNQRRFMADNRMKRAIELLEQKVILGEIMLEDFYSKQPPIKLSRNENASEEFNDTNLASPRVNLLSNGELTGIYTDNGVNFGLYQGNLTVNKTKDFLRRQAGSFFAITERDRVIPFTFEPINDHNASEQSVIFGENTTEYYANGNDLRVGMKVQLHPIIACELRKFAIKNMSGFRRNLILNAYFEPILASEKDFEAHPAFMNLFLKIRYDEERKIFILSRKDRHSNRKIYMGVGFINDVKMSYTLSREKALERNEGISSFIHLGIKQSTENHNQSVPNPALLIRAELPIEPDKQFDAVLFSAFAMSEGELFSAVDKIRNDSVDNADCSRNSPIMRESLEGRIALSMLPHIIFGKISDGRILNAIKNNKINSRELWSLGVSGDYPIVIIDGDSREGKIPDYIKAQHALRLCGISMDLVILTSDELLKTNITSLVKNSNLNDMLGRAKGIYIFHKRSLTVEKMELLKANSVLIIDNGTEEIAVSQFKPIILKKTKPIKSSVSGIQTSHGAFTEKGFVITKKPPNPWCNVLANPVFGTMVSDSSLGFTWALSSRENKLSPWHNDIMLDNDGELLVLKTDENFINIIDGSTASFTPNGAEYRSFSHDIVANTIIAVAEKGCAKVIDVTLENISEGEKQISLAYYVEPVLGVDRSKAYGVSPSLEKGMLLLRNNNNHYISGAMGVLGASQGVGVDKSYITSKTDFWRGKWEGGTVHPSDNPCASVVIKRILPPKQAVKFRYILSFTADSEATEIEKGILNIEPLIGVKHENIIKISTPDKLLDNLFNNWLPWQTIGGRMWARTGFYQNGGAYGFRDQLQDGLSANYFMPSETKKQILRACNAQFPEGDVLHWWHNLPNTKKGVRTRYSDDLLWLPYVIADYIEKTNDKEILDIFVNFINGEQLGTSHELYQEVYDSIESASVYEHGKRSIEKAHHLGDHGLILIGCGDWNDGYNNVGIAGKGESVWLSQFMIMVIESYLPIAIEREDLEFAEKIKEWAENLKKAIDNSCWENDHYIRAFYDNGEKMGSNDSDECQIDILPQAFATLANLPDYQRRNLALDSALNRLVDEENRLIKLFSPPFSGNSGQRPGYVASYPVGIRENGGQYTHGVIWFVIAMLESGRIDEGYELIKILNPSLRYREDLGEVYRNEPYYLSADVYTNPNAMGRGGWSIYTGAASWYYKCILENLLGIKISKNSIKIEPNLPKVWDKFKVEMNVRGTIIKINISREFPAGISENGKIISEVLLDGKEHDIIGGINKI